MNLHVIPQLLHLHHHHQLKLLHVIHLQLHQHQPPLVTLLQSKLPHVTLPQLNQLHYTSSSTSTNHPL
ncbi:hypothetical protein W5O_05372 [Candida albicans Ca6]|nr:hypothetical protein W5O_05372 [Candida albicans Ca6]